MKIINDLPSEFQKALPILQRIRQAGYEAYFVGGSVRDVFLNRPIHDVDIATSAYPQEIKKIFERTIDIGIEHGTVLVLTDQGEYEVTTFRTEDVYVDYRRPSQVSFVRSLDEDLKRRDFTVNAFALNQDGQLIDRFNGLADLEQGLLRAVGQASERFNEDALRILRGFRFAANLNFDIEKDTFAAMTACAPLLTKISVERSFIEFDKLLTAPYWQKGLQAFIASQAYLYLPDLAHKKLALTQMLAALPSEFQFKNSEQAWAYLLVNLEVDVKPFLKKWKTSVQFQKTVTQLINIYNDRATKPLTQRQVYDYGYAQLILVEELRQALGLVVDFDSIWQLNDSLIIHDKHEIVVNGGDLMKEFQLKAGPILGKLLTRIEDQIVMGNLPNDRVAIFEFVKGELDE
ncbi:CCA tRNA nucleotidyltransferase [Streptococcus sp. sy018]|uniref:CCA tRNA nucleotidyltransferase n=1 Tax=Streptococcus sp. sy018 TaxID=2600147 RepID=UPI0011B44959|nr:CCA tRNA nucleotidyltransferase [Streptococcus sp. sy018]TWS95374.1 CCA tRNA nucleotidyltransferase [Streptococcus sp. sy018]